MKLELNFKQLRLFILVFGYLFMLLYFLEEPRLKYLKAETSWMVINSNREKPVQQQVEFRIVYNIRNYSIKPGRVDSPEINFIKPISNKYPVEVLRIDKVKISGYKEEKIVLRFVILFDRILSELDKKTQIQVILYDNFGKNIVNQIEGTPYYEIIINNRMELKPSPF